MLWRVEGGGWRVVGGGWRVEGGGWRVVGGGWRVEYLVPRVGCDGHEARELFSLFDSEAVINVEHCLLPMCVAGLRSWCVCACACVCVRVCVRHVCVCECVCEWEGGG